MILAEWPLWSFFCGKQSLSLSRKGKGVNCTKTPLLENMAVGLETGALTVAHDLGGKQDLLNEIASFELASTPSGNLVLQGGGKLQLRNGTSCFPKAATRDRSI